MPASGGQSAGQRAAAGQSAETVRTLSLACSCICFEPRWNGNYSLDMKHADFREWVPSAGQRAAAAGKSAETDSGSEPHSVDAT